MIAHQGTGMTMLKDFIISVVVHACVFTLFQLVGNWIFHFGFTWVYYLVSGLLYGVLMTFVTRWMERIKKR
jgi:hypothetical protein